MSELRTEFLAKKDGSQKTNTDYVLGGSAKAWANLNGTGTIALRDSLNISSVVDHGTGNYSASFINVFADIDRKIIGSVGRGVSNTGAYIFEPDSSLTAPQVGQTRFYTLQPGNLQDGHLIYFNAFGELAQ